MGVAPTNPTIFLKKAGPKIFKLFLNKTSHLLDRPPIFATLMRLNPMILHTGQKNWQVIAGSCAELIEPSVNHQKARFVSYK